jgi:hypothetical protein
MLARIVRHAERQKMPSELGIFDSSFDESLVPITQTGIKACRDNANALLKDCSLIYHSPILRCRQTAEHINYQNSLTNLGESAYLMSEYFGELKDLNEVRKKLVIDNLLNGIDELDLGIDTKMNELFNWFKSNSIRGSIVYVTHDWWMALFLSFFTKIFKEEGYNIWPDFLEYFEIDFDQNHITYRDRIWKMLF